MLKIDTRLLWTKLEASILDQIHDIADGKAKMKKVVHDAAVWCAKQTPLPDVFEIPVYELALGFIAQAVFDKLRDAGRV